jgi:hypothetical protein
MAGQGVLLVDEGPCLIVPLPDDLSDEAALHLSEVMMWLSNSFDSLHWQHIKRAKLARQREQEEFFREQEILAREREFRAAQLDLPLDDPNPPF